MTDTMDLTGRKQAVETAIQGGRSLWDDAKRPLVPQQSCRGLHVGARDHGPDRRARTAFVWVHDYRTISSQCRTRADIRESSPSRHGYAGS